jgi:hypothetical protein
VISITPIPIFMCLEFSSLSCLSKQRAIQIQAIKTQTPPSDVADRGTTSCPLPPMDAVNVRSWRCRDVGDGCAAGVVSQNHWWQGGVHHGVALVRGLAGLAR